VSNSKETELKPCPFCGGEPEIGGTIGAYTIRCRNLAKCNVQPETGIFRETKFAKQFWNTRSSDTAQQDEEVKQENRLTDLEDQLTDCAAQNAQLHKDKEELETSLECLTKTAEVMFELNAVELHDIFGQGIEGILPAITDARALLTRLQDQQS